MRAHLLALMRLFALNQRQNGGESMLSFNLDFVLKAIEVLVLDR